MIIELKEIATTGGNHPANWKHYKRMPCGKWKRISYQEYRTIIQQNILQQKDINCTIILPKSPE